MRKRSIMDGVICAFIIIGSSILGLALFSYLKGNGKDSQQVAIQIKDNFNSVADEKKENESSNPIETIETIGSTSLIQNSDQGQNSQMFHGTKYFYNQLDDYAKIVYQAFESNIDNLKTGNYQIQFQNEFDQLLKQENGNDMLNDEFQRAWDAFSYDRPDVFYLDPNKFSLTVETTKRGLKTSYHVYISAGNNGSYLATGFSGKQQIDQYINQMDALKKQFVEQMTVMGSDYERVKALHDWMIDNIEYDSSMTQVHRYNIYGALMDRVVVCEGYAKLFKYILDDLGIQSVLSSGTAVNSEGENERHMWNYVKLDGVWYAVDCTWDDPIVIGGGKVGKEVKYKYFLKGAEFFQDHTEEPITDKSQNLAYPKIAEQNYPT